MNKRNENRSEFIANWGLTPESQAYDRYPSGMGLDPLERRTSWEAPSTVNRAVKRDIPLWGYVVAGILALSGFSSIVMTILGVGIY